MDSNAPQADTRNTEAGGTGRAEDAADRWAAPDFQVIETSMEVTAYFGAEL